MTAAPEGNWAKAGDLYVLADKLAEGVMQSAKVEAFERVRDVPAARTGGDDLRPSAGGAGL